MIGIRPVIGAQLHRNAANCSKLQSKWTRTEMILRSGDGLLVSERYEKLGEGGFGAVFHALDKVMNRKVALKFLKLGFDASEKNVSHFKREAKLLAQLNHRNIMTVYSFEWLDEISPIIVMEYLKGRNLQDLLNEAGCGLSYYQCRTIFSQLCSGLSYAHEQGIRK